MHKFGTVKKLQVFRQMTDGSKYLVGTLAQNKQHVFFQYDQAYLQSHHSLSPFQLDFNNNLQPAPSKPHQGLHGLFADSLPDGWGMLLMDRAFRQQGIAPESLTMMDRLAYIGTLLSLRSFKKYTDGFGVRCFCITVFSGSSYLVIGETRLANILIGGAIGIGTSIILSQIDQWLKHPSSPQ